MMENFKKVEVKNIKFQENEIESVIFSIETDNESFSYCFRFSDPYISDDLKSYFLNIINSFSDDYILQHKFVQSFSDMRL